MKIPKHLVLDMQMSGILLKILAIMHKMIAAPYKMSSTPHVMLAATHMFAKYQRGGLRCPPGPQQAPHTPILEITFVSRNDF